MHLLNYRKSFGVSVGISGTPFNKRGILRKAYKGKIGTGVGKSVPKLHDEKKGREWVLTSVKMYKGTNWICLTDKKRGKVECKYATTEAQRGCRPLLFRKEV